MAYKKYGSTKATSLEISRNIEQWTDNRQALQYVHGGLLQVVYSLLSFDYLSVFQYLCNCCKAVIIDLELKRGSIKSFSTYNSVILDNNNIPFNFLPFLLLVNRTFWMTYTERV